MEKSTKFSCRLFIYGGALALSTLGSCIIPLKKQKLQRTLSSDYCALPFESPIHPSYPLFSIVEKDSLWYERLGVDNATLLNSLGLIEEVRKLGETRSGEVNETQVLARINQRIQMAQNLISATAEELECEATRATRIKDYLNTLGGKRNNAMTVGAVFSGTLTGIAPLIIKSQKPQNAVIIAGSALSAVLGIAVLTNNKKKVGFYHERNLLADIWNEPKEPVYFPVFIWSMLNDRDPLQSSRGTTAVNRIKKRWSSLELMGSDKGEISLLFGKGGNYTEDELATRISLLSQSSTEIRLLKIRLTQLSVVMNSPAFLKY